MPIRWAQPWTLPAVDPDYDNRMSFIVGSPAAWFYGGPDQPCSFTGIVGCSKAGCPNACADATLWDQVSPTQHLSPGPVGDGKRQSRKTTHLGPGRHTKRSRQRCRRSLRDRGSWHRPHARRLQGARWWPPVPKPLGFRHQRLRSRLHRRVVQPLLRFGLLARASQREAGVC